MSNNKKLLESFTKYCVEHPQERFWQALRNWSMHGYIWVSDSICRDPNCTDTFYWEDRIPKKKKKKSLLM